MSDSADVDATKAGKLSLQIVELLINERSETRLRAINAALLILGETQGRSSSHGPMAQPADDSGHDGGTFGAGLSSRGVAWLRQNTISEAQLAELFHVQDGDAEFIGGVVPGQSERDRTCNAYILMGVGRLLTTGTPAFDDRSARELCRVLGCYDNTNHSTYINRGRGNAFTGSKEKGWLLTSPGLTQAATLIKSLTRK